MATLRQELVELVAEGEQLAALDSQGVEGDARALAWALGAANLALGALVSIAESLQEIATQLGHLRDQR